MAAAPPSLHPLERLAPSDRDLALDLVKASGSLKDVAALYQVSYPTLRARLDALLARITELEAGRQPDPMAEHLARLVEDGQITTAAAKTTLKLHRELRA